MNGPPSYPGGSSPFRHRASLTKTLPRFLHSTPLANNNNNVNIGNNVGNGHVGPASFAQSQSSSMYLSEWHGTVSDEFTNPLRDYGYPSDYGLPVSSGDPASVTVNPLTDLLYSEESDILTGLGRHQQQQVSLQFSSNLKSKLT
jgi:hypothetical protein